MLTDAALKHLKPKEKIYKVTDRDGMYVLVKPSGTLSFRLDYRMNGRRETVTFGKYGPAGLSLARARELCIDAKRAISEGRLLAPVWIRIFLPVFCCGEDAASAAAGFRRQAFIEGVGLLPRDRLTGSVRTAI